MNNNSLQIAAEKILDATDGGLDIILQLYPQADTRKNFRVRHDDKTPSANLKFNKDLRRWKMTDFGGTIRNEDAFGLYALENNIAYYEAILEIGRELQNSRGIQIFEDTREFFKYEFREYDLDDCPYELNEKKFHYIEKEFSEYELELLGPFVTKEDCDKVNLVSLSEYSYFNETKGKVFRFIATDKFPIMAFINKDKALGEWLKIYMPKGSKKYSDDGKDRRFRYVGGRPSRYVFGLDYVREIYKEGLAKAMDDYARAKELLPSEVSESDVDFKLDEICIATGGSDGLNMLSMGKFAIWMNSETEKPDQWLMDELFRMAKNVVHFPDTDITGKREGKALALEFLEMKTVWLDKYFTRNSQKDFKDYMRANQRQPKGKVIREVNKMIDAAMPAQFWEVSVSDKGRTSYNFHHMFGFYFLRLNGFCRIDDPAKKDGYYFAQVDNSIVKELKNTQPIKDYFKNFLLAKQHELGVRKIPYALLNMLITSQKLNDSHLAGMHNRTLDFTDFTRESQTFFLGNRIFKITKNAITEEKDFPNYVLESQLINNLIKEETDYLIDDYEIKKFIIDGPYFSITKVGDKYYDIEIKNNDCEFLNYLINTSRVHWEKEKKAYADAGYSEADFYEKSKFKITSEYLSDKENDEQKQHLINKIFAFGYAAHRFKDPTRPWVIFAADNAVIEDDVAEGGAGKSLFFEAMRFFMNRHDIDGKGDVENDKFLFEGVNQHTDFILFDDVRRSFNLESFFSVITSKLTVNEKFEAKVNLAYRNSPKFGVSTNYSIKDQRGSSTRRRLVMGFSDYYHASNDEREKRDPKDDFGHSMFLDWDTAQWFKFINFVFQACRFYLSTDEKIEAPSENIVMRAYLSEMGQWFVEWADAYIPSILDKYVVKDEVLEAAQSYNAKFLSNMTSNTFKKKCKLYAKAFGYEFEDRKIIEIPVKDAHGNEVNENGRVKKKSTEHIKFTKVKDLEPQEVEEPETFL
ncbi:hypothetical protein JSO62_00120 [Riemerella anatipestifer]|uniref:primase-helicase family protein n=1 Tax=Riemerella anatipestifer TaxID=34085 RepID=UPI0030BA91DB